MSEEYIYPTSETIDTKSMSNLQEVTTLLSKVMTHSEYIAIMLLYGEVAKRVQKENDEACQMKG